MPSGVRAVRTLRRKASPESLELLEQLETLLEDRSRLDKFSADAFGPTVLDLEDYDEGFRSDDPDDLEVVLDRARAAQDALDAFCLAAAAAAGLGPKAYERARRKGFGRAADKVRADYDGDAQRLRDGARGSLVAETEGDLARLLRTLMRSNGDAARVVRFANRFRRPPLARCLDDGGRGDAAAAAARRALAALGRAVGDGGPAVAACHHALGVILRDGDEAEAAFATAVARKERHFGFGHLRVAASWRGLGKARLRVRKFAEAEQAFRRDVAISEDKLGPDAPELAARYNNYAMLLWRLGRPAEAAPFQEKGLAIKRRLGDAAAERTYDGELDGMLAGEPYPYGGRAA